MHQNRHVHITPLQRHAHMAAPTDAGPDRCICRGISAQMHLQRHVQTCIYTSTFIKCGCRGTATQVHLNRHVHTASNICMKEERQTVHARMRGKNI